MTTTIQISEELQNKLNIRKFFDRETYEEVIWDLLEDTEEISEETKKELAQGREEVKAGKLHTLADIEKEMK